MIEKPKRPKKIPNQDNKQPQTIEQLIRRYDLDNTKIYDFLDEFVDVFNQSQTKNVIFCKCLEDTSITIAESATNLPLTIKKCIGNGFSLVNGNAIKVGTGIKYVKVSANLRCKSSIANTRVGIQPTHNDTYISSNAFNCITANTSYGGSLGPILLEVVEGDLICLNAYIQSGVTVDNSYTNITVEAVG